MLIGAKEPLAGGGPGCPERYFQKKRCFFRGGTLERGYSFS